MKKNDFHKRAKQLKERVAMLKEEVEKIEKSQKPIVINEFYKSPTWEKAFEFSLSGVWSGLRTIMIIGLSQADAYSKMKRCIEMAREKLHINDKNVRVSSEYKYLTDKLCLIAVSPTQESVRGISSNYVIFQEYSQMVRNEPLIRGARYTTFIIVIPDESKSNILKTEKLESLP